MCIGFCLNVCLNVGIRSSGTGAAHSCELLDYHFFKLRFILFNRGGRHVAVKIVKNVDRYCEAAQSEIQVLEHLNATDPHSTL